MCLSFRALYYLMVLSCVVFGGCYGKGGILHRVEQGQTLLQVSQLYDVPVKSLVKANPRIHPDQLGVGQKILIPGRLELRRPRVALVAIDHSPQSFAGTTDQEKPSGPSGSSVVDPGGGQSMTLSWPGQGSVISKYGKRKDKMHHGIDIEFAPGAEVLVAEAGRVVFTGDELAGYGKMVIVKHVGSIYTVYAYLGDIVVNKGQDVKKGDAVGRSSKNLNESFVHFEIRRGKASVDPLKLLPSR